MTLPQDLVFGNSIGGWATLEASLWEFRLRAEVGRLLGCFGTEVDRPRGCCEAEMVTLAVMLRVSLQPAPSSSNPFSELGILTAFRVCAAEIRLRENQVSGP